jgi:nucleoside-diphosphate-sugar epimerase
VLEKDLAHIANQLRPQLPKLSNSRLLITGGAGFLGYYLVQAATHLNATARANIDIVVYDSFSRGKPQWLSDLTDARKLRLVEHDMRHPLPADHGRFDWIIHAASIASPIVYRRDPIGTMDANINGLRNLLDRALADAHAGQPIKGMLFFSSSEIYGDPDAANIPTAEDYRGLVSCTGPRACYDEAKRYGETLCANFARQHGVPVKMARPFNNYGPGLNINDGRVIPDFCRDVLSDRDIVMLSDGRATRTFCYAADSITGYYKVLIEGGAGEPYNIGVETPEISMADLARKIAEIGRRYVGYTGKVVTAKSDDADYLVDNPNRRCPIITKARTQIGYDPRIDLDEGLDRVFRWYAAQWEGAGQ